MKTTYLALLITLLISCVNKSKEINNQNNIIDTVVTKKTAENDVVYDSAYVIKIMGADSFNLIRVNYRDSLIKMLEILGKAEKLRLSFSSDNFKLIEENISSEKIRYSLILNSIPISPAEFKIYDSFFYDDKYLSKIENFERLTFLLSNDSNDDFVYKAAFCIAYTNMYAFIYSGLVEKDERLDDGYYYYGLNTIMCKNNEFFCKKVWRNLSALARQRGGKIYKLYDCRCNKKVTDEGVFCN